MTFTPILRALAAVACALIVAWPASAAVAPQAGQAVASGFSGLRADQAVLEARAHRPARRAAGRAVIAQRPGVRPRPGVQRRPIVRNRVVVQNRVVVRPVRHRPHYGLVVAGVTLGAVIAVSAARAAPPPPSPELCWFWADKQWTAGYWDYCG